MGKRTLFEEKPLRNFFCGWPIGKPTFHPNDNWPTDIWSLTTGLLFVCAYSRSPITTPQVGRKCKPRLQWPSCRLEKVWVKVN